MEHPLFSLEGSLKQIRVQVDQERLDFKFPNDRGPGHKLLNCEDRRETSFSLASGLLPPSPAEVHF